MTKNIALLTGKLGNGGAEKVAANLSLYLAKQHNVFLFLRKPKIIDYDYRGEIVALNFTPTRNQPDKVYQMLKRIWKTRQLKKEYNIDISISFLGFMNFLNVLTQTGDKIIISEHADPQMPKYNSAKGKLYRNFYGKADSIIAVSRGVKKSLGDMYSLDKTKIYTIYNSFNIKNIKKKAKKKIKHQYKSLFNNPVIINAGRLAEEKGQWHLIRVFQEVKKEIANAKLIFLGEGDLEDKLIRLARNLGLEESVHFLGFQSNPYNFIKEAELFAFSSLWEGFGNVLVESMACGTPVVSTDCKSGPREILAPDTDLGSSIDQIEYAKYGILTPVMNKEFLGASRSITKREQLFAKEIVDLLQNSILKKKYSKLSKRRAEDFKSAKVIPEWEKIINE